MARRAICGIDLAGERRRQPDAHLGLAAGADQFVAPVGVPGPPQPLLHQAAEDRLVEAELPPRLRRSLRHLPADLPLARRDAARDDPELDAVRLIEVEAVAPVLREVLAAAARLPEAVDRRPLVERHRCCLPSLTNTRVAVR